MKSKSEIDNYVTEFSLKRDVFGAFAARLESLLHDLLKENNIGYHIVESRAKTVDSFREKITRSGKNYVDPMSDIPDLCGCRVITYYMDDVPKIGNLIKDEFKVEEVELSHQPAELDPDRFGYISAHYIVKLRENRSSLGEWRIFDGIHAEIQVRTVIQHAWSAVSHALQYKQETSVPSGLQRRLYRIAGIFELADEEFVGIRDQKNNNQAYADEAIKDGSSVLSLTTSSIIAAIKNWNILSEVRTAASVAGFTVADDPDFDLPEDDKQEVIPDIYRLAKRAGISNTESLVSAVDLDDVVVFEQLFDEEKDGTGWTASDDFLFFLMLARKYKDFIHKHDLIENDWSEEIATRFVEIINPEDLQSAE